MKHLSLLLLASWIGMPQLVHFQNNNLKKPRHTSFFDRAGMDTTVLPGNDFFTYANGKYVRNITIPGDWIGWGVFPQLIEENQLKTKAILEETAASGALVGRIE